MAVADLSRAFSRIDVDRRTLVAGAAAAAAALLVLVLTRPDPLVPVLVAGADIPAGVPLGESSITTRLISSAHGLVEGDTIGELSDWSLATPVAEGEPLLPSLLRPPTRRAMPDAMAVTIESAHAALGTIRTGDRIDIYATWAPVAGAGAVTERIARDVWVIEARTGGTAVTGRPQTELLLAVDDDLASGLARAINGADIDLVRRGP